MQEPKLIIFDCDGTIVDSEKLIVTAMITAFEAQSLSPPASADIRRIIGLSLPLAVEMLLNESNPDLIAKVSNGYKEAYSDLRDQKGHPEPMFDGALELIRKLNSTDHYILGIATGKSMRGVERLLDRFELAHVFQTIQTSDNAPSKPNPAMLHQAMTETGIEKQNAVMIGDTTFDMEMALNARVPAIGVTWGHHQRHELALHSPRYIIDEFHLLEQTIVQSFASLENL